MGYEKPFTRAYRLIRWSTRYLPMWITNKLWDVWCFCYEVRHGLR